MTFPVPDKVPLLQSKLLLTTISPVPVNSPPLRFKLSRELDPVPLKFNVPLLKLKLLESLIIADSKVTEAPVIAICPLPLRVPPVIP